MDRVEAAAISAFETGVEAVRMGYVFGHDAKQYRRWKSALPKRAGRKPEGLTGAGLEAHVASLRLSRPDLVGVAP